VVARVVAQFGRVDILVVVPATGGSGTPAPPVPAETLAPAVWQESLTTLVSTAFYSAQAAAGQMLKQGSGVIAILTSVMAFKATEGHVAGSAAHAALVGMTKALGIEWASRGVRVVAVALPLQFGSPSPRTPLTQEIGVQEVAEALFYLSSDEAAYITAEIVPVDGGWTAYQLF
jgi:3-oxoacyl-[acyl-carrier protein] reductase